MEGFTKLPKMQCFKEGGYVTSKPKSVVEKTTKVAPTGDKKANAKSAAVAPKEKEEKVDITTMKKGGRAKKATGTVKKFIKQESKKPSGDKDAIKKVKPTGNKKANAPSKAAVKGKEIKKFADGGMTGNMTMAPSAFPAPGVLESGQPYNDPFGSAGYAGPGVKKPTTDPSAPIVDIFPNDPRFTGTTPTQYGQPNFSPTFTNTNTFNASGGADYGFGGSNPMQNPAGQQQPNYNPQQNPAQPAPAAPAAGGSVNLLPSLFGAK